MWCISLCKEKIEAAKKWLPKPKTWELSPSPYQHVRNRKGRGREAEGVKICSILCLTTLMLDASMSSPGQIALHTSYMEQIFSLSLMQTCTWMDSQSCYDPNASLQMHTYVNTSWMYISVLRKRWWGYITGYKTAYLHTHVLAYIRTHTHIFTHTHLWICYSVSVCNNSLL